MQERSHTLLGYLREEYEIWIGEVRAVLARRPPKPEPFASSEAPGISATAIDPPPIAAPVPPSPPAAMNSPPEQSAKSATEHALVAIAVVRRQIRPQLAPGGFTAMIPGLVIAIALIAIFIALGSLASSMMSGAMPFGPSFR